MPVLLVAAEAGPIKTLWARVISGPCTGQWGLVTGKHGGINHVMVDFSTRC